MAGLGIGHIGAYDVRAIERQTQENENTITENDGQAPVWVSKRYIPTDLRHTAPVPRHKLLCMTPGGLPDHERHWVKVGEVPLSDFKRENGRVFTSHPSSRCEEWSTLRQMLPSWGNPRITSPPNWGTGINLPPILDSRPAKRYPKVNSPMTRYVDAMHLTNRLFKLH